MKNILRNSFSGGIGGNSKKKTNCSKVGNYLITDKVLGKGAQSIVYEGIKTNTLEKVAIKRINKKKLTKKSKEQLIREIKILKKLSQQSSEKSYVVKLLDAYNHNKESSIDLVFEKVEGGELYDLCIQYETGVPEDIAKPIFYQIVKAVKQLHDLDIAHLDLKLENIMYNSDKNEIKLIDFGFAAETVQYDHLTGEKINLLLRNFAGSIHFVSPEIITHQPYDGRKSDIWSIGILLYAFLVGKFPFDAEENEKQGYDTVFEKILDGSYGMPNRLSNQAKDLISRLLCDNPNQRLTASDILNHPFFDDM